MTDESFWSTRNIAEYAYCPRLFYLMEVEGIFLPSEDTEKGKAVHRKTDKRTRIKEEEEFDSERPKVVRSLVLSSKKFGITATLDIAEISGQCAVPVEYRKGKPYYKQNSLGGNKEIELWSDDKVQIGLQTILLEEAGFKVKEAVVYYAGSKFKYKFQIDEEIKTYALSILEEAKKCACSNRPLPLINDRRCERCSLQPICLPDEINSQKENNLCPNPRKMWPPRDEGIHIVAQTNGSKLGVRSKMLVVTDKDGNTIKEEPLVNVESIALLGSVQITTQAVHTFADMLIPIAYLSGVGRLIAMIDPLDSVSADVRRRQVRKFDNADICLELSKAVVSAKIQNQRTILMRNHPNISKSIIAQMADEAEKAEKAIILDELRGYEGQAAAMYFENFGNMFTGSFATRFNANGRQRRPPPDPINCCLSMGYSLLTNECVSALRLARLEPSIGAFHVSRPGRPALALDLMEPFRPLIADSVALMAFNRDELTEKDFHITSEGCIFSESGRKSFFNCYSRRMDTEVTHPVFKYKLSYRRMLMLHAKMLTAWLIGDVSSLSFITTR